MTQPFAVQSHDGATETGYGEQSRTKGHTAIGLYVLAKGLDPGSDTLTVQLHTGFKDHDGDVNVTKLIGETLEIEESQLQDTDGNGEYEGFVSTSNIPSEYIRAYIEEFDDADTSSTLEVDTFLMAANSSGSAHRYTKDGTV